MFSNESVYFEVDIPQLAKITCIKELTVKAKRFRYTVDIKNISMRISL